MNVLVVNAGSSSLKYQLFDTANGTVVAKSLAELSDCNYKDAITEMLVSKYLLSTLQAESHER